MKNIAIIGHGAAAISAIERKVLEDAGIDMVEADEVKDLFAQSGEPSCLDLKLTAPPILETYPNQKQFICKGKHQYRKEGTEWICQCGRNIND